jgi:predicted alpha/beta-fold hydrolase
VNRLCPAEQIVPLPDGDAIVLHEDRPASWRVGDRSMLLVHGLSGCHTAPYMLRLADRFISSGICVFRMDMRGCGAGSKLSSNVTHAGRSSDVLAALDAIAEQTQAGLMSAIAVSLGGNQLLRAVGRIGGGLDPTPAWFERLERIAVVAPPLDLKRCSDNMERWAMRPYNYYFIRSLLARAPARVRDREDFQLQVKAGRPRTIRELDDRITAPLSGFADAAEYYAASSASPVSRYNAVPTLVLAAADDPIVPIGCFVDDQRQWPASTELVVTRTGGHVGFIDRKKRSWMDDALEAWFA